MNVNYSIGDKIVIIKDGELRKGEIKCIYSMINPPILAVEFGDGTIEKIICDDKVAPAPKESPEEKNEPVEKSEITITPDEFRDIVTEVVARETKDTPIMGILFASILGKIHRALFIDPRDDEKFFN